MAKTPNNISLTVNLKFEGVSDNDQPPASAAYAFDANGQFLASAAVERGKATFSLPSEMSGQTVRFFAAPPTEKPTISRMAQLKAIEFRQRLDPKAAVLDWTIVEPVWRPWFLCSCVVRGRLIKRVSLPDGRIKELPICHSRVTICTVFEFPRIIYRLPDDLVRRLRDEFIAIIKPPFPPPPPGDPFRLEAGVFAPRAISPPVAASPGGVAALTATASIRASAPIGANAPVAAMALSLQTDAVQAQTQVRALAALNSVDEIRQSLVDLSTVLVPYLCWWPWLNSYLVTDCFTTVMVDENGYFQTTFWYPCVLGAPNIYIKAEQLHGMVWEWIYRPSVYCNTYWNYSCGTEVVINVTDPSAIPCAPADPVDPPAGVVTWIMPFAVGGTPIWGAPPLAPPAPAGWLKSNGLTDYGGFVDAPFGSFLGFRHGWSISIPSVAIKYYRWQYRKTGTSHWFDMQEAVVRHYVKQPPVGLPTFPIHTLGPYTVGAVPNLYEFKGTVPPPDPGDPAGTITYWPTDDFFADIYTGYLDTLPLPPSVAAAAGQYQIKLDVFNPAGVQVMPGPAFSFIVPNGYAADGVTVTARNAQAGELDAGGFVFNLHIDNNHCTASIDAPRIGIVATADECGFLRYNPMDATPVTIAFHAQHPNLFATFGFTMVRGAVGVPVATTSGEVAALVAGSYTGDGVGNFTHDFPRGDLLGACVNAAFAEYLYVYAKATTGWGTRISTYDASGLRAFALSPTAP